MAAATVVNSFVFPLGPRKIEVANLSAVDDTDTYTSSIQGPEFGFFVPNNDGGALTAAVEVSISSRTITLNSVDLSTSTGVLVLVGT